MNLTLFLRFFCDSGKFGVLAELVDGEGGSRMLLHIGREGESLDYWEGE